VALDGVSLKLEPGQIIGLFGENGAGKTTLMKCILGFLRYHGEITLDGEPITPKNIARLSFATSEHSFFPGLTAWAHREFYAEHFPSFNPKRFDALMEFFELPKTRPVGKFSTGQKNQFEVILAVSQGADYILMDEPFAGNDVFNREDFYKVLLGILEPHETILLSTHLLEEVEPIISRAVLMHKGQIIGDTTMEALEDQGQSLMQYVKQSYNYRSDRVGKALRELTGEEG
jgi:ABC-2 type transport system ATP-binding protein